MSKADWTKAFQELMKLENTPNALLKQMVGGMANLHDDLREILLGSDMSLNRVNELMAKVEAAAATNAANMMSGVPRAVQAAYVDSTLLFDELLMSFETVYPMGIAAMPAADMGTYAVTNTTGLITAVTREIQFQVSAEVLQGILLERKPTQVMQRVSHVLGIRSTGQFREFGTTGISYKAEKIVRTEMMATANAGIHDRMKMAGQTFPDLEKVWMATGDWRCRDEHLEAHGQKVAHDGEFSVGGEQCQFPLDPSLSARMRINCRCGSVPYRPSWGELGELTGVLDEAVAFERGARILPVSQMTGSPMRFVGLRDPGPFKWKPGLQPARQAINGMFKGLESDWLGVPLRKGGTRKVNVILTDKLPYGVDGEYVWKRAKGRAIPGDIKISTKGTTQGLTYSHEFGHLVDSHFLSSGTNSYASTIRTAPGVVNPMNDLRAALKESEAVQARIALQGKARSARMQTYYNYTLETPELFAQSFAQYVATKSQDPILLKELSKVAKKTEGVWWSAKDFEPISEALDALFKSKGWL